MAHTSDSLSAPQAKFLAALLAEPSIVAAAAVAGVTARTAFRWLGEAAGFQLAYREAKREAVAQATARLQGSAGQPVEVLLEVATDPDAPASARVTAARTVLDAALKASELEDLGDRLQAVEDALNSLQSRGEPAHAAIH